METDEKQLEKARLFFRDGHILCIDKPLGWTSFDVVNKIRKQTCSKLKIKKLKVGHAGTLDPLATGLLVICFGKCTKQIEKIQSFPKTYDADIELGKTTPSFDLETEVDAVYPSEHIGMQELESCLSTFLGEQEQIPPIFSAVKIDGKRAYELAREGKTVALEPKKINIHRIECLSFQNPQVKVRVECSKGTYIRALARDIGVALNSGAHLNGLRRLSVGKYHVDESVDLLGFENHLDTLIEAL